VRTRPQSPLHLRRGVTYKLPSHLRKSPSTKRKESLPNSPSILQKFTPNSYLTKRGNHPQFPSRYAGGSTHNLPSRLRENPHTTPLPFTGGVTYKLPSHGVGGITPNLPSRLREGIEGRATKAPSAFSCRITSFCPLLYPPPQSGGGVEGRSSPASWGRGLSSECRRSGREI